MAVCHEDDVISAEQGWYLPHAGNAVLHKASRKTQSPFGQSSLHTRDSMNSKGEIANPCSRVLDSLIASNAVVSDLVTA